MYGRFGWRESCTFCHGVSSAKSSRASLAALSSSRRSSGSSARSLRASSRSSRTRETSSTTGFSNGRTYGVAAMRISRYLADPCDGARFFSQDVEAAHRLLLALEGPGVDLLVIEAIAEPRQRGLADDDLAGQGARAQPGAGVRRVADDRVRERLRAADVTDDARARVDADADGERGLSVCDALPVEAAERLHLIERALHASDGIVPVGEGSAPEGHDAVAHELVERPLVLEQRLDHELEVLVQHLDDHFGRRALAHRGEAADVAVEDGQLLDELA